jgi:hypothetical protein
MQLGGDLFQLFHLRQRQLVIGLFTPVRLAVHGVEVKAVLGRFFAPVRALGNTDSFHDQPPIEREEEVPARYAAWWTASPPTHQTRRG